MPQDLVVQALAALREKKFAEARDCIASYANDNALEFQHYLIKGLSEIALGDWNAAQDTFAEATRFFPHQPQLWLNLGIAQENLGKTDDAAASYEHSLDLKPDQADACGNLSNIYRKQGRFEDAEHMAHRAYELGAPKAQALNTLALALGKQGKFEAAEKIFKEARQLEPQNAQILANLANLKIDQLKFDEAWPLFAAARIANDNATTRRDEGMARLLAGDYTTGWPLYEARLELPNALRMRPACPFWRGENLQGKRLLLIAEQGFGDTIQFCRYGRLLAEKGATLIWLMPKPLQSLLGGNLPGLVLPEGDPIPAADYWLPIMSLPLATGKLAFGDTPPAPYLRAPIEPRLPEDKKLAQKIGVVWTASPTNERDYEKSMHISELAPLWPLPNTKFYAPFVNPRLDQITNEPIVRLDKQISDFADTAAFLAQMDCVISVCTASAHLAGALGVKTYLLLPYCADWRWGAKGEITPWYPSVTLLRQPEFGDWESVVGQLKERLT
jgi:tetratricopeptide (TPR) repeat protein